MKGTFASVLPVLLIGLIVLTPISYAVMERSGQGMSYDMGQAFGAAAVLVLVAVLPITLWIRGRRNAAK